MDSASVISLSSTSSRASPIKSESVVSVITVSSEPQRVPVSWESGKGSNKEDLLLHFERIPDYWEKVSDWMETCVCDAKFEYPEVIDQQENNQTTCIRYDFDKTPSSPILPQTCYTESTPLVTYLEETKKNTKKVINNGDSHRPNGGSVNNNDTCTPLSPDSQKIELCSYLQLMKPEDTKENNFYLEYRRSGRVKSQHNLKKDQLEVQGSQECKNESSYVANTTIKAKIKKIKKVFNLKRKLDREDGSIKLMPLPPKQIYSEIADFEDSVKAVVEESLKERQTDLVEAVVEETSEENQTDSCKTMVDENIKQKDTCVNNGCLKKVEKRRRFKFGLKLHQKLKKGPFSSNKISLRSNGHLRDISLDKLILRKSQRKKKARKKLLKKFKDKIKEKNLSVDVNIKPDAPESPNKALQSPSCEVISVHTNSDDENVDLRNFVDDMLELDKMSAEHRKSVIENRILASSSITNLLSKKASQGADIQRAYKIFSDLSNERKNSEERESSTKEIDEKEIEAVEKSLTNATDEKNPEVVDESNLVTEVIVSEHDYASYNSSEMDDEDDDEGSEEPEKSDQDSLSPVPLPALEVLPMSEDIQTKSLHRSLTINNKRRQFLNKYGLHNWSAGANYNKKLNHSISISEKNGSILQAFYQEYNLIIAQENLVSFWTQSALGNVLGAQNMWIPKGDVQRINLLNNTYTQKNTMDMVITTETSIAFVELWTKEHKSDVREAPMADVFATVYFWRVRQTGLDKKALQLEKIQGFAEDVQYCILTSYPKIIVSWHSVQGNEKKTKIRSYHLATDFQTVANISEIQPVQHYVCSLHNIEDGDSLIMGYGENKITLWNVEHGYIVATIEMSSIESPLSTLWVKCDRGFLFVIQECVDHELRLIAINGMNHSWKKLQNYNPPSGFSGLKGVCIDNGILVTYYPQGIVCWNAQSGELIVEEIANECEYIPSGKNVIMLVNNNIIVRHSLSHLITDS